jgi:hypothetical protein
VHDLYLEFSPAMYSLCDHLLSAMPCWLNRTVFLTLPGVTEENKSIRHLTAVSLLHWRNRGKEGRRPNRVGWNITETNLIKRLIRLRLTIHRCIGTLDESRYPPCWG